MLHFVVNPHDPKFDYDAIGTDFFGDNKCLVMLEVKPSDHCHIQGDLKEEISENRLSEMIKKLSNERDIEPKYRPVKRQKKGSEALGFQYICNFTKVVRRSYRSRVSRIKISNGWPNNQTNIDPSSSPTLETSLWNELVNDMGANNPVSCISVCVLLLFGIISRVKTKWARLMKGRSSSGTCACTTEKKET